MNFRDLAFDARAQIQTLILNFQEVELCWVACQVFRSIAGFGYRWRGGRMESISGVCISSDSCLPDIGSVERQVRIRKIIDEALAGVISLLTTFKSA